MNMFLILGRGIVWLLWWIPIGLFYLLIFADKHRFRLLEWYYTKRGIRFVKHHDKFYDYVTRIDK